MVALFVLQSRRRRCTHSDCVYIIVILWSYYCPSRVAYNMICTRRIAPKRLFFPPALKSRTFLPVEPCVAHANRRAQYYVPAAKCARYRYLSSVYYNVMCCVTATCKYKSPDVYHFPTNPTSERKKKKNKGNELSYKTMYAYVLRL